MLPDLERKTLRVLASLYGSNWVRPDLLRVAKLSQRDERRVRSAVKVLVASGYIEIKDGQMRIIHAFDLAHRQQPVTGPSPWVTGKWD